jgi:hypothetical protein
LLHLADSVWLQNAPAREPLLGLFNHGAASGSTMRGPRGTRSTPTDLMFRERPFLQGKTAGGSGRTKRRLIHAEDDAEASEASVDDTREKSKRRKALPPADERQAAERLEPQEATGSVDSDASEAHSAHSLAQRRRDKSSKDALEAGPGATSASDPSAQLQDEDDARLLLFHQRQREVQTSPEWRSATYAQRQRPASPVRPYRPIIDSRAASRSTASPEPPARAARASLQRSSTAPEAQPASSSCAPLRHLHPLERAVEHSVPETRGGGLMAFGPGAAVPSNAWRAPHRLAELHRGGTSGEQDLAALPRPRGAPPQPLEHLGLALETSSEPGGIETRRAEPRLHRSSSFEALLRACERGELSPEPQVRASVPPNEALAWPPRAPQPFQRPELRAISPHACPEQDELCEQVLVQLEEANAFDWDAESVAGARMPARQSHHLEQETRHEHEPEFEQEPEHRYLLPHLPVLAAVPQPLSSAADPLDFLTGPGHPSTPPTSHRAFSYAFDAPRLTPYQHARVLQTAASAAQSFSSAEDPLAACSALPSPAAEPDSEMQQEREDELWQPRWLRPEPKKRSSHATPSRTQMQGFWKPRAL